MDKNQLNSAWDNILKHLKNQINNDQLYIDFKQKVVPFNIFNQKLYLVCDNPFKKIVENQIYNNLKEIVQDILGSEYVLHIIETNEIKSVQENDLMQKKVGHIKGSTSKYRLEQYIVGQFNKLAHKLLNEILEKNKHQYNPIFIYSDTGLGKTHLICGFANKYFESNPDKNIIYMTAEEFARIVHDLFLKKDISNVLFDGEHIENFKNMMKEYDVLIIDDIQFLSQKIKTNEIFFNIFNALVDENKLIILTSDKSPEKLDGFDSRMISRFSSGVSVKINNPDAETLKVILKERIQSSNLKITDAALDLSVSYFYKDIRKLLGLTNNIFVYSLENEDKRVINDSDIKEVLDIQNVSKDPWSQIKINPNVIISAVAGFYNVKQSDIISPSRKKEHVNPRDFIIYILRDSLGMGYKEIGTYLGNRSHSTIMSAFEKMNEKIKQDSGLLKIVNEIINKFE